MTRVYRMVVQASDAGLRGVATLLVTFLSIRADWNKRWQRSMLGAAREVIGKLDRDMIVSPSCVSTDSTLRSSLCLRNTLCPSCPNASLGTRMQRPDISGCDPTCKCTLLIGNYLRIYTEKGLIYRGILDIASKGTIILR